MKKFFITISALLLSFSVFADEVATDSLPKITSGKQYVELSKYAYPEKEVIQFFSFNCPSCLRFDTEFYIGDEIEENLPEGVKFKRYHLENYGPLSKELSQAWAIATVLEIEKQVVEPLFNGVQVQRNIRTADDIKAVFASVGVGEDEFEKLKNNFRVKAFMAQQREAYEELKPASIPLVVINRKFYINARELDQTSTEASIKDFSRVTNYVLTNEK